MSNRGMPRVAYEEAYIEEENAFQRADIEQEAAEEEEMLQLDAALGELAEQVMDGRESGFSTDESSDEELADGVYRVKQFHGIKILNGQTTILIEWEGYLNFTWEKLEDIGKPAPVLEKFIKDMRGVLDQVQEFMEVDD